MTLIDEMIEFKIARNEWHAAAIANRLHLADLPDDDKRLERALLYRGWRNLGMPTARAFEKAIAGHRPISETEVWLLRRQRRDMLQQLRRWQVLHDLTLQVLDTCKKYQEYCADDIKDMEQRISEAA